MESTSTLARPKRWAQSILQSKWSGRAVLIAFALFAAVQLGLTLVQNPALFAQQAVNGLQLGFVYALISLGYTMVYGIVRLINFAHGDVFMVGAFVSFYAVARYHLEEWPARLFPGVPGWLSVGVGTLTVMALSMITCGLLAFLIERVAYKPLRNAPRISALITAIGMSFFLEYFGALQFVFTPDYITYQRPFDVTVWSLNSTGIQALVPGKAAPPGGVLVSNIFLIIVAFSLFLLFALQFVVRRTRTGKAMRAVAYDKEAARLMGINADSVISATFIIGGALAGAGGMLYAIAFPQVFFWMGVTPGLKAFVAAVLGGIGSIPGAMVGSLIMGVVEVLSAAYISTPMRDAIAFSVLILVLLIRPTGIFGEPETNKV